MCTPVYVTIKATSSMAPLVNYLVGAVVLGIASVICFVKAIGSKTPSKT